MDRHLNFPAKCWFQRVHHQGVRSSAFSLEFNRGRGTRPVRCDKSHLARSKLHLPALLIPVRALCLYQRQANCPSYWALVPRAVRSLSRSATFLPRLESTAAMAAPMMPPPTIATSYVITLSHPHKCNRTNSVMACDIAPKQLKNLGTAQGTTPMLLTNRNSADIWMACL